mmetsp:Transcript_14133/g.59026  ORF Transcript_14133/g.59026 Transcript_14133/m.59026 type:complete len:257 (+) Transcript_14133:1538-2308(+)
MAAARPRIKTAMASRHRCPGRTVPGCAERVRITRFGRTQRQRQRRGLLSSTWLARKRCRRGGMRSRPRSPRPRKRPRDRPMEAVAPSEAQVVQAWARLHARRSECASLALLATPNFARASSRSRRCPQSHVVCCAPSKEACSSRQRCETHGRTCFAPSGSLRPWWLTQTKSSRWTASSTCTATGGDSSARCAIAGMARAFSAMRRTALRRTTRAVPSWPACPWKSSQFAGQNRPRPRPLLRMQRLPYRCSCLSATP